MVDGLKLSIGLAAGGLVFSAGLEPNSLSPFSKIVLSAAWGILAIAVAAGLVSFARIPVAVANRTLDLRGDKYLNVPGMVHDLGLILGFLALGVAMVSSLWG